MSVSVGTMLHLLCASCWRLLNPNQGEPVRHAKPGLIEEQLQCCHCGSPAKNIWFRELPAAMNCEGSGGVHEAVE